MKNKGIFTGIGVLIVLVAVFFVFRGFPQIAFTSGCSTIPNPNNPSLDYTAQISDSTYTCDADECAVWGKMNIIGDNANLVKFRTSTSAYNSGYIEILLNGVWSRWDKSSQGILSSCLGYPIAINTPEGYPVHLYNGASGDSLYVCKPGDSKLYRISTVPAGSRTPTGINEVVAPSLTYDAKFNFCPDPNFPYCSGSKNPINQQGWVTTDEFKISKGQTVTFTPKYINNNPVTEKYIFVRKGDCTCKQAVANNLACDPLSNNVKCLRCPTGYTFGTRTCETGYNAGRYTTGVCYRSINNDYNCVEVYTTKQSCDGNKTIISGSITSSCSDYKTESQCSAGEKCILDSNGLTGEGIGNCKCPTAPCSLGDKRSCTSGESQGWQSCVKVGSCTNWESTCNLCPEGLIYDVALLKCVCNPINTCEIDDVNCINSDSLRNCILTKIGDNNCYIQNQFAINCLGDKSCANGICSCSGVNDCTQGKIQCITPTSYKTCDYSTDPNSCLSYDNSEITNTDSFTKCENGQLVARTDIGCEYNTPGKLCSDISDIRGIKVEVCKNNACSGITDNYTAASSDYTPTIKTKCYANDVYVAKQYIGNFGSYYRWEFRNKCTVEEICRLGACVPSYQDVGIILPKAAYAIGEKITNITVDVTSNAQDASKDVIARLLDGTTEISGTRVNTIYNSQGKVYLNFNYAHPRSGSITLEVIVGDPNGVNYKVTKPINILKTLEVKPNCNPIQGYIGRDIICSWTILDRDTNTGIIGAPTISLKQGIKDVNYNPLTTNSLSFKTDIQGSVSLTITAEKDGYISDTKTLNVAIQGLAQTQTLLLDNKDISLYSSTGITAGTKSLTFKVEESGADIAVQDLNLQILTPSGNSETLTFNKDANGNYNALYNFAQPGQVYVLTGLITFEDISKAPLPVEYRINTVQSTTEDLGGQYTLLIVGLIIGIVAIIVVIVLLIVKRKK